jgi:predicted TIM-barrel fold metal-dependent hydrolase
MISASNEPRTSEDASSHPLARLYKLQSRIETLAEVAADYPNRFAPEPSWRLDNAIRYVNNAIAALGVEP